METLREKKLFERIVKNKKETGRQKISSKGQLTGILTELPGNRNFFPVAGINSGQTGIMAGLIFRSELDSQVSQVSNIITL